MFDRFIACVFLAFITISSMVFFLIALLIWVLTVFFDRRLLILHYFTSFWGSVYTWVMPAWSVSIEGKENIGRKTYVVISNHQSLLDILVACRIFFPFKWVSKAEIFKIPFIGWNMTLNRYIKLVRGNRKSVRLMLHDCADALARGSSVYIFPEGTRSESGEINRFKTGAFILAKENKVPVLPIVIHGTKDALPKHSLNFHGKHLIKVKILAEMFYEEFKDLSAEEVAAIARKRIDEVYSLM